MMRSVVILASMPRTLVNAEGVGHHPLDSRMFTYLASALHCSGEQKSPGSGQNEVQKGKNTDMVNPPRETLIHRSFFFSSQAH